MSFLRPAVRQGLHRHREVIATAALAAFGVWVATWGGAVYLGFGAVILAVATGWAILALRALRFRQAGEAPGVVRVREGQVGYLGPRVGGFVGLSDLAEVRLLTLRGRRVWQLRQANGATLHIPVEALGAEALYDAFATLPGIDTAALVLALTAEGASDARVIALNASDRLIWARKGAGIVPR